MSKSRNTWTKSRATKSNSVPEAIKAELDTKANHLIENVLKPKHVQPPKPDEHFNYIVDLGTKWYRNYFYLFATYACPGPNAMSPTFESKFARLEHTGIGRFILSFARHNGEWVAIYDGLSVDECLIAIQNDDWFQP